jgi:hypothetical protein
MIKWLLTLFIAVAVAAIVMPRLMALLRLGRLPGDITVRLRGRTYIFPFATALVLSLLAIAIGRLF